jgi:small subunit ribosomal protein S6
MTQQLNCWVIRAIITLPISGIHDKLQPALEPGTLQRAFPLPAGRRFEREQFHGKEETLMRKYELVCIVQPELDETAFKGVVDRVSSWITDAGGSVDKVDVWGRRRMAYQIRKQREGQYVLMNVTLDPKATSELERNIRFLEPVLRHMLSVV